MPWTDVVVEPLALDIITADDQHEVYEALRALTDPWTPYSSTWRSSGTQPTLGNGTLDASYRQAGKFGQVSITFTVGSSSSFGTGTYRFDLPSGWSLSNDRLFGSSLLLDASGNTYIGGIVFATASTITARIHGLAIGSSVPTSAIPFTWTTGDKWYLNWFGEVQT